MSYGLNELIDRFDKLLSDYGMITTDEVTTVAEDGLVLVDRRITRTGKKADGALLPDYSIGYKLEKKRAGKYRGFVDLTYTGKMWRDIKIVSTESTAQGVKVVVGGSTPDARVKMESNADVRGDFLQLSNAEVEILVSDSQERLTGTINGYFE